MTRSGLVDLAFFESVQDRCAARLFGSWLLLVRGRVRRAGAGPMAVTVNATECWDLPALEEIRTSGGMAAVRAAMAAGDVGPGAPSLAGPADAAAHGGDPTARPPARSSSPTASSFPPTPRPAPPAAASRRPPRTLWHASPGSTATPD